MLNRISELFSNISLQGVVLGIVLFLGTLLLSLAIVSFVLIKIPPDYFQESHSRELWSDRHPGVRIIGVVGKNILGVLLIAIGIVLSIPGIPGQGLLTILLGIMLVDIPGKRRLEYKLVSRPQVLKSINKLRHKFGRPSLVLQ